MHDATSARFVIIEVASARVITHWAFDYAVTVDCFAIIAKLTLSPLFHLQPDVAAALGRASHIQTSHVASGSVFVPTIGVEVFLVLSVNSCFQHPRVPSWNSQAFFSSPLRSLWTLVKSISVFDVKVAWFYTNAAYVGAPSVLAHDQPALGISTQRYM